LDSQEKVAGCTREPNFQYVVQTAKSNIIIIIIFYEEKSVCKNNAKRKEKRKERGEHLVNDECACCHLLLLAVGIFEPEH
jgi:hypothetical protein